MLIEWAGFFIAIAVLLVGARYHLGLAMITAAIVLGLFTLDIGTIGSQILETVMTPDNIVVTAALSLIPIIGGTLQLSGQLDDLVKNLRVGKRPFLGIAPAMLGLLPLPGGALFSAPLIDKAGEDLEPQTKAGINVWFRHILFFVYPYAPALFIPISISNLSFINMENIFQSVVIYQVPFLLLSVLVGYFFLLRKVKGELEYVDKFSMKKLLPPLIVLLNAPFLDIILSSAFPFLKDNSLSTFLAIGTSLILAIYFSFSLYDFDLPTMKESVTEMKPWNFAILIMGIYIFIDIFSVSGVGDMIASLSLPIVVISIGVGFLLGLVTGRIVLPASIVIPIMMTSLAVNALPIVIFVVTFLSMFIGYAVSPVHPCISISLEYFDGRLDKYFRFMAGPIFVSLATAIIVFFLFA